MEKTPEQRRIDDLQIILNCGLAKQKGLETTVMVKGNEDFYSFFRHADGKIEINYCIFAVDGFLEVRFIVYDGVIETRRAQTRVNDFTKPPVPYDGPTKTCDDLIAEALARIPEGPKKRLCHAPFKNLHKLLPIKFIDNLSKIDLEKLEILLQKNYGEIEESDLQTLGDTEEKETRVFVSSDRKLCTLHVWPKAKKYYVKINVEDIHEPSTLQKADIDMLITQLESAGIKFTSIAKVILQREKIKRAVKKV